MCWVTNVRVQRRRRNDSRWKSVLLTRVKGVSNVGSKLQIVFGMRSHDVTCVVHYPVLNYRSLLLFEDNIHHLLARHFSKLITCCKIVKLQWKQLQSLHPFYFSTFFSIDFLRQIKFLSVYKFTRRYTPEGRMHTIMTLNPTPLETTTASASMWTRIFKLK